MDALIEIIVELFIQLVVEVVAELGWRGATKVLSRPWLRLVVASLIALGAGVLWTRLVRPDTPPLLVTTVAALQWVLPAALGGRRLAGITLTRERLATLAAVGTAYAAGRWLGLI